MGIFEKLFGKKDKRGDLALKSGKIEKLWENIPAKDNLIGRDPRTQEIFQGSLNPKVRLLCATAECIEYIDKLQAIGINEGVILFSLMDEASVVCFINEKRMSNEIKKLGADNPELDIECFPMDTYPILRICLHWKRIKDDSFTTFEITPDIMDINVQSFFSNFLKSNRCWIYVVSAEDKIPMLSSEGYFDKERIHFYAVEISKAIDHFHKIPNNKLDYQQALDEFQQTHPFNKIIYGDEQDE